LVGFAPFADLPVELTTHFRTPSGPGQLSAALDGEPVGTVI
jgi:hypothetical protein